jgi:ABC-type Mn2+/Zn2+ transport system permease subunit
MFALASDAVIHALLFGAALGLMHRIYTYLKY